jgi:hypothetical protein
MPKKVAKKAAKKVARPRGRPIEPGSVRQRKLRGEIKPKPHGRPTTLTPEVSAAILDSLRRGNYFETAVLAQGVPVSTARTWLAFGRQGRAENFVKFFEGVKGAEAVAEESIVASIRAWTEKQWTAAAWLAERRFPERWAKREPAPPQEDTGPLTLGAIAKSLNLGNLSPDELKTLAEIIAKAENGDKRGGEGDA